MGRHRFARNILEDEDVAARDLEDARRFVDGFVNGVFHAGTLSDLSWEPSGDVDPRHQIDGAYRIAFARDQEYWRHQRILNMRAEKLKNDRAAAIENARQKAAERQARVESEAAAIVDAMRRQEEIQNQQLARSLFELWLSRAHRAGQLAGVSDGT